MASNAARVLLISPMRDEAAHVERVARAVAGQTRPPDAWIVVDDGSVDATAARVATLAREIPFLRLVSTPPGFTGAARDRLAAAAAPRAFNFGLAAAGGPAPFSHIGKLDGDTELGRDYLEALLERFASDPLLGVAGGVRLEPDGRGGWRRLPIPREHVPGALKLYTRDCLAAIGGVRELLGWDAIDETYARMHGYTTRSFPELETRHHRAWGTADGRLRGRARYGQASYVARQGPLWAALKAAKVARLPPPGLSAAAYLYGYARAWARSAPRVEDEAFARFVRRELRGRMLRLRLSAG